MKLENTYFEDIFHPIINLWNENYDLVAGNKSKSYIISLSDDFTEIEYTVEIENLNKQYNIWHFFMVFVIYQVLTEKGVKLLNEGETTLHLKNIPLIDFEKQFLKTLQFEGNEKYLKKYKGLKPR